MSPSDNGERSGEQDKMKSSVVRKRRKDLSEKQYIEGVISGDRTILARTITLIESNATHHQEMAQRVLKGLASYAGDTVRIGITGVPGAGKSTFIDTFGNLLCEKGHRVAVLAVDPSSSLSRGSIMGDKTRMERLSQIDSCFIRPSPSGGTLGGVARKTRESMIVCEAAGFDIIIVETVGVGQSESIVSTMVDFFLLLTLTGAGDELQSVKKGVIEMADAILINKADGDNKIAALRMQTEFNHVLHYISSRSDEWETQAYCCSALTGDGIEEAWNLIKQYKEKMMESGSFETKRQNQLLSWLHEMIMEKIKRSFFNKAVIKKLLPEMELRVMKGSLPVTTAADELLREAFD